jgi:hypothetical protein
MWVGGLGWKPRATMSSAEKARLVAEMHPQHRIEVVEGGGIADHARVAVYPGK